MLIIGASVGHPPETGFVFYSQEVQVSGGGISRDLNQQARKVYQSSRVRRETVLTNLTRSNSSMTFKVDIGMHRSLTEGYFDTVTENTTHYALENEFPRIPKNTTLVGEIARFLPIPEGSPIQSGLIELKNGTVSFVSLPCKMFRPPTQCLDLVGNR